MYGEFGRTDMSGRTRRFVRPAPPWLYAYLFRWCSLQ